ncbi:MAG: creatininase family protein [Planctomycetota bacterium]
MTDLAKLTWPQAQDFFNSRTIAIVPIGSTEPHGPHLPLDTDVTIAREQALRAARKLDAAGARAIVLPPLAYGLTNWTEGFAGRVTLRPGTLWALLEDLVLALEREGIRQIVFSNAHLEPEHVQVLRGVAMDHPERTREGAQVLFVDVTRRANAEKLGDEFRGGDCHAGRYESSLVMAVEPEAVRESERRALPPVRIDLLDKMKAGVTSFRKAGATRGYCGDPAAATAVEGESLYERLADMICASCRETWPDLFR